MEEQKKINFNSSGSWFAENKQFSGSDEQKQLLSRSIMRTMNLCLFFFSFSTIFLIDMCMSMESNQKQKVASGRTMKNIVI